MLNLGNPPAIGYETSTYNASECYINTLHNPYAKGKNDEKASSWVSVREVAPSSKVMIRDSNLGKAAGYFPIVGMVMGILRIQVARSCNYPNKVTHIIRGTIEFLCLGILLLIPDLIMTAYYACKARKQLALDLKSPPKRDKVTTTTTTTAPAITTAPTATTATAAPAAAS